MADVTSQATGCTTARRQIRAVILDAGGVILHPNLDWIVDNAAVLGLRVGRQALFEGYYRTIHQLDLDPAMDRRGPAFTSLEVRTWFFSRMLSHAGAGDEQAATVGPLIARRAAATFPRESDIYHWAMPGIRVKLEALAAAGFLLGSASNNDDALTAQLTSVGVIDLFSALKDSGVEGVAKPDPELLLRAARALQVPPAHCLYVGDVDRVDGEAARAAKMAFALLDPLDQPRPTHPHCIRDLAEIVQHYAVMGG